MIPFSNFQDTGTVKILYSQFLENDSDGNVLEFITNNILHIGGLLGDDDDDDDAPQQQIPSSNQQQHPFQPIQITPGFLYCAQSITLLLTITTNWFFLLSFFIPLLLQAADLCVAISLLQFIFILFIY